MFRSVSGVRLDGAYQLLTVSGTGQSHGQLVTEFKDIRTSFDSRYVRLFGACDREGF